MTKYIRDNQSEVTKLDEEWVILNSETFTVTSLNSIGGFCWELLATEKEISDIVQCINEQFEVEDRMSVQKDVESFISELIGYGLVRKCSAV